MADQINAFLHAVNLSPAGWTAPGYILIALIQCFLLINVIAVGALVFIWMERKIAGRIQDRLGPTRVGGKFGWLQTLADGLKLITKEDLMPDGADGLLFKLAPYLSFAASFTAFLALPFASGWAAQVLSISVFFVLAVLGLEVFGVILAGYGSGSKWAMFGAMREAAQVVSYEVPLALSVLVPVCLCGTMSLVAIGDRQAGLFTNWLIFHDPFTFGVFGVYFVCALASVNRAPFDLAEAESELVAGFHTEYSGLRWSIFFMAEYGSMFVVSGLGVILFFGAWHGPIPIFEPLASQTGFWPTYLANLAGCANFILKTALGVTVMIWIRWTVPRPRVDQVITMCWKYCVPIAGVCFVGAVVVWQYLGWWSPNDLAPRQSPLAVREPWVLEQDPKVWMTDNVDQDIQSDKATVATASRNVLVTSVRNGVVSHGFQGFRPRAKSNAVTSPSGRGRASGAGVGEADVGVAPQVTLAHPLPAATASDLPRCAGEVTERNKPPWTQTSHPNQSPLISSAQGFKKLELKDPESPAQVQRYQSVVGSLWR